MNPVNVAYFLEKGFGGAHVMLTDHFSVPFDPEDGLYSSYMVEISHAGEIRVGENIEQGNWYVMQLEWDCTRRTCKVSINDQIMAVVPLLWECEGVCYLRLKSLTDEPEQGGLLVEHIDVEVENGV